MSKTARPLGNVVPRTRSRTVVRANTPITTEPVPFPPHGEASETFASWQGTQRTVRRKKSSFDLRDVFKNGGVIPTQTSLPVH